MAAFFTASAVTTAAAPPLSRSAVFQQAWPIMLGQASVPLVGIVDTAVIGRTGDVAALAGVALGASVIMLVFWTFGFLRMGLTGLTAQAAGVDDKGEVEALLLRSLIIGFGLGLVLLVLSWPLSSAAFALLAGGQAMTAEAGAYVGARFLGAPAALTVYALTGWLLGLGRTREALVLQVVMNVANIAADVTFVWGFAMGAAGVGLGTALAEWAALVTGLLLVARVAGASLPAIMRRASRAALLDRERLTALFAVNRDIMIRTIALLLMFLWFANAGARLGAAALAANYILLQFVNVAAFILDAFAFTAESRVGNAVGQRDRAAFLRAIRLTGEFSLVSALVLVGIFLAAGGPVIRFLAGDAAVVAEAQTYLIYAALIPLLGLPSWMLDGIFIGATRGKPLRNAGVAATLLYIALDLALRPMSNQGVWIAISATYLLRAGGLALYFPALVRDMQSAPDRGAATHI